VDLLSGMLYKDPDIKFELQFQIKFDRHSFAYFQKNLVHFFELLTDS